ncbi:MAG: hypothetical protein ACXWG1_04750 [Usitatibacter sp.]
MAFRIDEDETLHLVRVTLEGVFDKDEVEEMVGRAREASASRRWNILYDLRAATPGKVGPGDLFWLPRRHPALKSAEVARVRVAALHLPEHAELAKFWENSFRNAGLAARAFTEEASALEWLARGKRPKPVT